MFTPTFTFALNLELYQHHDIQEILLTSLCVFGPISALCCRPVSQSCRSWCDRLTSWSTIKRGSGRLRWRPWSSVWKAGKRSCLLPGIWLNGGIWRWSRKPFFNLDCRLISSYWWDFCVSVKGFTSTLPELWLIDDTLHEGSERKNRIILLWIIYQSIFS